MSRPLEDDQKIKGSGLMYKLQSTNNTLTLTRLNEPNQTKVSVDF